MKMIERTACVLTNREDLEDLYTFHDFPIFMGVTDQPEQSDKKEDMVFAISKGSGMIQLRRCIPQETLYSASHNSSLGEVWRTHHRELAGFINRFHPKAVFEIGGGCGRLECSCRVVSGEKLPWVILEPSPAQPLPDTQAQYIHGFWNRQYQLPPGYKMDMLVHSHVFEHMYDPNEFVETCSAALEEGKYMIFSLPNLYAQLQRKYTNALNFEHTFFISEPYVEWLLAKNGFEIADKQYFGQEHSIFYAAQKKSGVKKRELPDSLYRTNYKLFMSYIEYYTDLVKRLNRKIRSTELPVYLFGAHIFSQSLIEFGLETDKIRMILDNDPLKQGKRLYGTDLKVASPKVLGGGISAVILKVASYADEIKADILQNINSNVEFWE